MKVLVTGGAGFIGSHIVDALVSRGDDIVVLDNLSTGSLANIQGHLDKSRIDFIKGDIRFFEDACAAMNHVDAVVHCAALASVSRSVEDPVETNSVNVDGTLNLLLRASRAPGIKKFVFSSSSSVYGNTLNLPKRENMAPAPRSPYATQKLTGEFYCRNFHALYKLKTYCLRYFNVYGPRQNPNSQYAAVIPRFITALLKDEAPMIHGDGKQTRDFTFVADVVAANLACLDDEAETGLGEVFNVCGGHSISINELAENIGLILDKSSVVPTHSLPRPGDVKDSLGDCSKAYKHLGWKSKTKLKDGLVFTCEHFKEKP